MTECIHVYFDTARDENDDRIRVVQRCGRCEDERYGCFAKRLDDEGRTAWGPVGEWYYTSRKSLKQIHAKDLPDRFDSPFVYREDTQQWYRLTADGLIPVTARTVAIECERMGIPMRRPLR